MAEPDWADAMARELIYKHLPVPQEKRYIYCIAAALREARQEAIQEAVMVVATPSAFDGETERDFRSAIAGKVLALKEKP
jgi:hypothetical protein